VLTRPAAKIVVSFVCHVIQAVLKILLLEKKIKFLLPAIEFYGEGVYITSRRFVMDYADEQRMQAEIAENSDFLPRQDKVRSRSSGD
jgi:hypothetical protein